jgi:hypothetical protein
MKSSCLAFSGAVLASTIGGSAVFAQEDRYIDDRSSAASIVTSLYNAVNRHEYARAWDYYGDTKPANDFDSFVTGYEATDRVDVKTGNVASEGAAGSTFYYLPVAILSINMDGSEKVFAGCYTARSVNPQIQEPPFRPLHIEKGSLQPVDTAFEDSVPESCPDAPAPEPVDTLLQQAQAAFAATHGDCDTQMIPEGEEAPSSYTIPFRYKWDADSDPMREARLFRFFCSAGAYNLKHIYYLQSDSEGLRELQFATPELDVRYVDDNSDEKVDSINVAGFVAADQLVNSSYDAATLSITSHSLWRGIGDASSSGLWIFRDGDFTLVKFEVDASYDGEINPQTVVDYDTAP